MGYTRKALEKGFLEMYGLGLGEGVQPYFFKNWPLGLMVWVFFLPALIRYQTECTAP